MLVWHLLIQRRSALTLTLSQREREHFCTRQFVVQSTYKNSAEFKIAWQNVAKALCAAAGRSGSAPFPAGVAQRSARRAREVTPSDRSSAFGVRPRATR